MTSALPATRFAAKATQTLGCVSININDFRTFSGVTPAAMLAELQRLLPREKAIHVILMQEVAVNTVTRKTETVIPGFVEVCACPGQPYGKERALGNAIYIHSTLISFAKPFKTHVRREFAGIVPRCAAMATILGMNFACVHAPGGRFDDEAYESPLVKDCYLGAVINAGADIIAGDFNGSPPGFPAPQGSHYTPARKPDFGTYFHGGHATLVASGYERACPSSADYGQGTTTRFTGAPVDWVYARPSITILGCRILDTTRTITDHKALYFEVAYV